MTALSETTVAQLRAGAAPVREPGLDDLIARQIAAGSLHPVTTSDPGLGDPEFTVVATDVEVLDDDTASLDTLEVLVKQMGSMLRVPTVLIVMSQVPVGTSHRLAASIGEEALVPPTLSQPPWP